MLKCLVNINGRIRLRPVRLEDVWNMTHYHYIIDLMRSIMRVEDRYYEHHGPYRQQGHRPACSEVL